MRHNLCFTSGVSLIKHLCCLQRCNPKLQNSCLEGIRTGRRCCLPASICVVPFPRASVIPTKTLSRAESVASGIPASCRPLAAGCSGDSQGSAGSKASPSVTDLGDVTSLNYNFQNPLSSLLRSVVQQTQPRQGFELFLHCSVTLSPSRIMYCRRRREMDESGVPVDPESIQAGIGLHLVNITHQHTLWIFMLCSCFEWITLILSSELLKWMGLLSHLT